MLNRYDLGVEVSEISQRVYNLEQGRSGPTSIIEDLRVTKSFTLLYDLNTHPNSILFSDTIGAIRKRSLSALILDVPNQITITGNDDGTLYINLPQDLASVSTPTFSGLNLLGDLTTTGNIDGVNIALFYGGYISHIDNSTTAHFGQNLK
jgi:hypothetical protein